jgi:hypothetical protein
MLTRSKARLLNEQENEHKTIQPVKNTKDTRKSQKPSKTVPKATSKPASKSTSKTQKSTSKTQKSDRHKRESSDVSGSSSSNDESFQDFSPDELHSSSESEIELPDENGRMQTVRRSNFIDCSFNSVRELKEMTMITFPRFAGV